MAKTTEQLKEELVTVQAEIKRKTEKYNVSMQGLKDREKNLQIEIERRELEQYREGYTEIE